MLFGLIHKSSSKFIYPPFPRRRIDVVVENLAVAAIVVLHVVRVCARSLTSLASDRIARDGEGFNRRHRRHVGSQHFFQEVRRFVAGVYIQFIVSESFSGVLAHVFSAIIFDAWPSGHPHVILTIGHR